MTSLPNRVRPSATSPSTTPKIHPLIVAELRVLAQGLREQYPGAKIRNAVVFESGIRFLARHRLIQLVGGDQPVPNWMPERYAGMLRRLKNHPIWVPGPNYPRSDWLFKLLHPSMRAGKIVWGYTPSKDKTFKEAMLQNATHSGAEKKFG